ncbi:Uncharacterised protein [uncultured archaeon]|nr:Uncharacterised protein [uncultured archaeon]
MGIFDFWKKKTNTRKQIIALNELDSFIEDKKKELEDKKAEFESIVKKRLLEFTKELEEKSIILEKVDLREIRSDERAKLIVSNNLEKYIINLDRMIESLTSIEPDDNELTVTILKIIDDFEKRSFMNYEKATFLIGKELGAIKDSISRFLTDLNTIILENQDSLDSSERLFSVQTKKDQAKQIEDLRDEINDLVLNNMKKISLLEVQKINSEEEIEKIKTSDKYAEEIKTNEESENKRKELEKTLYELKQMIDFKALANVFHYDPKKMNAINEYSLNFNESFEKDNGIKLVRLLEEAGKNDHLIIKKINGIIEKNKELNSYNVSGEQKNKILALEEKIKKIKQQMSDLEEENSKEKKKSEKMEQNKREVINSIKTDLHKMNVELK